MASAKPMVGLIYNFLCVNVNVNKEFLAKGIQNDRTNVSDWLY